MPLEKHSLVQEFPAMREQIHDMKINNSRFAKLFVEYDEIGHIVHRIESGAEAASDERLEQLKKMRLALKDGLFSLLNKAA